jgi:hypothetical protein
MENNYEEARLPGGATTFHLGGLGSPSLPFVIELNGRPAARSNLSRARGHQFRKIDSASIHDDKK